jgi:hypothetical protein
MYKQVDGNIFFMYKELIHTLPLLASPPTAVQACQSPALFYRLLAGTPTRAGKLKDKVSTTPAGGESTGGGKLKDKLKGGN